MAHSSITTSQPLPEAFLVGLGEPTAAQLLTAAAAWMGFLPGMELAEGAAQVSTNEPAPAVLAGMIALLAQTPGAQAAALAVEDGVEAEPIAPAAPEIGDRVPPLAPAVVGLIVEEIGALAASMALCCA